MHARSVPIGFSKWLRMPINSISVFFSDAFKQITCNPDFIACSFRTLGEYLKFPLAGSNFSIDALYVDTCIRRIRCSSTQALPHSRHPRAVVRPYRDNHRAEIQVLVVGCAPQEVLLLVPNQKSSSSSAIAPDRSIREVSHQR